MKYLLGILLSIICFHGLAQELSDPVPLSPQQEALIERNNTDQEFRNPKITPLEPTDTAGFRGLEYFAYNPEYRVAARYEKVDSPIAFKMKTTTSRLPDYRYLANAYFTLGGKEYKLEVYQNVDLVKRPGYEDYLFVPFGDETNGEETYGGGRFLDLHQPTGNIIVIDFNLAYNPYCAYNHKYSCPIPPPQNRLEVRIPAGVKKFHKD